ncbi:tryptophan synthase subunit beta [Metapseudomonas lalkuanensis]|uniref:Tryptophan synthase subunit beta n=1 Tax=Metapseudomonas lalkuanensis TaxID=2604832 RepID=A0A5J6QP65_9GAMM|nr:tryptophan synthase subunit beta [Pseudomonas lalkuanensis]QEY64077.1 tryptophan synthase subunit beta [Pseudomonas lalkuanensis]UCO96692.1 tryptophan synthase subunit beta [Pseudomonas lalkuanensis]
MVYVQRDEKGRVLRVEHEPFDNMTQSMPANDPEVRTWFASRSLHDHLMSLQHSDLELVRVIEDLVQVLVSRGVMNYTDLPAPARHKLQHRANTRSQVEDLGELVPEDFRLPY